MINAEFVEKALLGTLLVTPTRRADIPWLDEKDLTNPLCRSMTRHLDKNGPAAFATPIDYTQLASELSRTTGIHPRLLAPSAIAELHMNAPARPDAVAYPRIVVEVSIREQLECLGLRLISTATQRPNSTDFQHRSAGRSITDLRRRWEQIAPSQLAAEHIVPSTKPTPGPISFDMSPTLASAERNVVAAAIHDLPTGTRATVVSTIAAADLQGPRARASYLVGCRF